MIQIAISQAAFDAVAATMPLGSVGYETEANAKGGRLIWVEAAGASRSGGRGGSAARRFAG